MGQSVPGRWSHVCRGVKGRSTTYFEESKRIPEVQKAGWEGAEDCDRWAKARSGDFSIHFDNP